jgi:hypothetical protein
VHEPSRAEALPEDALYGLGFLARHILLVLLGMLFGFVVPNALLDSVYHNFWREPIGAVLAAVFSILFGLAPVVLAQVAILKRGRRERLVKRWLWFVSAAWIAGAIINGRDSRETALFGALGGGLAGIAILLHAHISGRSRARAAGRASSPP